MQRTSFLRCYNSLRYAPKQQLQQTIVRYSSSKTSQPPPLAFAFDIDGVLLRGPDVLPAAKRALNILEGNNPFRQKIPFILLTNGGGVGERERCEKLSAQLGLPISTSQYCQAHTILKKLSPQYADSPVLVLGGQYDTVRNVAKEYGYQKVYTTLDVLAWNPSVWPFHRLSEREKESTKTVDFSKTPISAIFVYHDPRNWALDIQVACDVILSGGIVGGPHVPLAQQKEPVKLVFCNPDLLWRSDFPRSRFGQGAFKTAFQAVFKELTGSEYPYVQFGKPTEATYTFAKELLLNRVAEIYGENCPVPQIYMVGDNPESDIAGANAAKWPSILVNTGVYDPAQGRPTHIPTQHAEDVEEAVKWAIEQELTAKRRTKSA
ncbi:hypothetical protein D9613_000334 [Agrocybe pediades]|uniref:Uncharacterized protein n=1 Tax=Agrocybe pediades TaxID=84607 RepID=A0A8H4VSB6_9AGAR|nr:hypothetical protein D9613_000334 [Agrocybe pediades]